MAVNKVVCTGRGTVLDLGQDTITSGMLFAGYTAHAANGEVITGTLDILNMKWNDLSASQYNRNITSTPESQSRVPNKVILGNRTLIDLTSDSANNDAVIADVIFHRANGHQTRGHTKLSELTWNEYEDILDNV